MPEIDLQFAIQWSRVNESWQCMYCQALSENKYFGELRHLIKKEKIQGNLMIHKIDCPFLEAYTALNGLVKQSEVKKKQPKATVKVQKEKPKSMFDYLEEE